MITCVHQHAGVSHYTTWNVHHMPLCARSLHRNVHGTHVTLILCIDTGVVYFICQNYHSVSIGIYRLHFPQIYLLLCWLKRVLLACYSCCQIRSYESHISWADTITDITYLHVHTFPSISIQLYIGTCDITTTYHLITGLPFQYKMWKFKLEKLFVSIFFAGSVKPPPRLSVYMK